MERHIRLFETELMIFTVLLFAFQVAISKAAAIGETTDDADLDFPELAEKYGLLCEEYDVTTEDGYILKLFHIPGNKTKPFLISHGLMDSSDTGLLRGHYSLGYLLSKEGYDYWSYNYRGNKYSRRHVTLNPDTDKAFWDFSLHEHAVYDLPAAIDFVLNKTGMSQLALLGYSEGSAVTFILGSVRPEYNDKVNIFIAMTPICFFHNLLKQWPISSMIARISKPIILSLDLDELASVDSIFTILPKIFCSRIPELCIYGINYIMGEMEHNSIDPELMRVLVSHYPAGTSMKNFLHFYQFMTSKRFAQYDYGPAMNLVKYKSKIPPRYNLKNVTMKTAMFIGGSDQLSVKEDLALLVKQLPNIVFYKEFEKMNHITMGYSRMSYKRVYPDLLMMLQKYT